jgi:hypothetical protein
MQIGRVVKNSSAGALAVALVAGLAGCIPPRSGYVVNPGGGQPLELRSVCDGEQFSAVWVLYEIEDRSAFDAQEPIWQVEFPEGSEPGAVLLFQDNPGGAAQFGQADIDWDRDMSVAWESEGGSGFGLGGDLGDLAPGSVIWQSGVEELDVFEQKAPKRGFGCQPPN